jgi:SAM-dependent methyltransferase
MVIGAVPVIPGGSVDDKRVLHDIGQSAAVVVHWSAMEGYDPSTYGDRIAEVYDSWYSPRMDPVAAVELLAGLAGDGRVLELGIGTGRVAMPLAQRGVAVSGIDASEAMVAKLRAKPGGDRVPVTIGNFADVDVPGTFSLIYVPFTTFFALQSQEEQIRCLQNVVAHLDPGGHFVMDAFVPDVNRFGSTNSATTTQTVDLDHVVLDAMRHDPLLQIVEGHHVVLTEEGTKLYPVRIRYCWPSELDVMAQLAGLVLEDRFASYDGSAFDASSGSHVSVYRKLAAGT